MKAATNQRNGATLVRMASSLQLFEQQAQLLCGFLRTAQFALAPNCAPLGLIRLQCRLRCDIHSICFLVRLTLGISRGG
jgi:hypothetical protein